MELERRAHSRIPAHAPATLVAGDRSSVVPVRDVSRGGVSFDSDAPLTVGAAVELHFAVALDGSGAGEARLPARIVWCTEIAPAHHQVGALFLDVDATRRLTIERVMAALGGLRLEGAGGVPNEVEE